MNENIINLINNINDIPGDSLIEKILSYCEENDLEAQEIGDILADSKHFKRVLWIDAVRNNQIQDLGLKNILNETEDFDEW